MKTSTYQVILSVTASTDSSSLLRIQIHLDGVRRALKEVVSSLSINCSEAEWLGQCDAFTAVYRVSREDLPSSPLLLTVTPLYHLTSQSVYKLQSSLASLVGRSYLLHPKYSVTCLHSYARANSLYQPASRSIKCDAKLRAMFGCPSIRLDRLWPEITKLLERTELDRAQLSFNLSDLDKEYHSLLSLKTDHLHRLYPSFYCPSSRSSGISKTVSLNDSSQIYSLKRNSFKRSKSVEF